MADSNLLEGGSFTTDSGASAPTVEAGGPYSGDEQTAIALDTASVQNGTDPNPTKTWSVEAGSPDTDSAQFSSTSIVNPTFTPSTDGAYVLKLAVDANDWPEVSDTANLTATAGPVLGDIQLMLHGGQASGQAAPNIVDSSANNKSPSSWGNQLYSDVESVFEATSIKQTENLPLAYSNVSTEEAFTFQIFLWENTSDGRQHGFAGTLDANYKWHLGLTSSGDLELLTGLGTETTKISVPWPFTKGTWGYIKLEFDGTQWRLYAGPKDGQATLRGTWDNATTGIDTGLRVGGGPWATTQTWEGYFEDAQYRDGAINSGAEFPVPTAPLQPPLIKTPPSNVNAGGPYTGDQNNSIPITATFDAGSGNNLVLQWTSNRLGEGSFLDANAADTEFTPTGTGAYILTFTATNDEGSDSDTANLTSNIVGTPISFGDTDIPNITLVVDIAMSNTDVSGYWSGTLTPFDFTSIGTALPPGINLSSNGIISGTPTAVALTSGHVIQGEDTGTNTAPSNAFSINVIDTPEGLGGIYAGTQGPVRHIWAGPDEVDRVFAGETLVWQRAGIINTGSVTAASLPNGSTMSIDISTWDVRDGDMILIAIGSGTGLGTVDLQEISPGVDWDYLYERSIGGGAYGGFYYIDSTRAEQLSSIVMFPYNPDGAGGNNGYRTQSTGASAIHIRGYQYPYYSYQGWPNTNSGSYADPRPQQVLNSDQLFICGATLGFETDYDGGYEGTWIHPEFEMVESVPRAGLSIKENISPQEYNPPAYSSDPVQPDTELPTWVTLSILFNKS